MVFDLLSSANVTHTDCVCEARGLEEGVGLCRLKTRKATHNPTDFHNPTDPLTSDAFHTLPHYLRARD